MSEKAQQRIVSMIKMQAKRFPCLHFKYEYDASVATHIVDVDGKDTSFLSGDEWQNFVFDSVSRFESDFKGQALLFVSEDSLVRADDDSLLFEVKVQAPKAKLSKPPKKSGFSNWLTLEALQVDEQGYVYNPHADTPEGGIRKQSSSSLNFSLKFESVLTDVKTDFFVINR